MNVSPTSTHDLGNARVIEDLTRPGTTPRVREIRPGQPTALPTPAESIRDLRWLRKRVLERLDAIEAMARYTGAVPVKTEDVAALERSLRQRLAEVEETRSRLRDEAERRQEEWAESLAQIEDERRSLAEAWERIERQRIEGHGDAEGQPAPHGPPRAAPTSHFRAAAPASARPAATDPGPDNPVTRAILREFQSLSRDVRNNAAARRDPS